jgi:hypothetical protein
MIYYNVENLFFLMFLTTSNKLFAYLVGGLHSAGVLFSGSKNRIFLSHFGVNEIQAIVRPPEHLGKELRLPVGRWLCGPRIVYRLWGGGDLLPCRESEPNSSVF